MKNENVILITRMYAGKFLENKIGHEMINLVQTNSGENYIYVTPNGTLGSKHTNVESILLVTWFSESVMNVVAKATGLTPIMDFSEHKNEKGKQRDERLHGEYLAYLDKHEVNYGGVCVEKIFDKSRGIKGENQVSITYKAQEVLYPKKPLCIYADKMKINKFPKIALHLFYGENRNPEAYKTLTEIINDSSLWETENHTKQVSAKENADCWKSFTDKYKGGASLETELKKGCKSEFYKNYEAFLQSINENK